MLHERLHVEHAALQTAYEGGEVLQIEAGDKITRPSGPTPASPAHAGLAR
jgi:hypothetical protein